MLRGAIFDMDGVLVDNMKVHMKVFAQYAHSHGVEFDPAYVMSLNGMGNADFFSAIFPPEVLARIGGVDAAAAEKEALYRKVYAAEIAPARGLMALLESLRAGGVRMAVGTSAMTANLDFVLDSLGIRPCFDALVTADMVTRTKPDPEIYLRALTELGLAGNECLVFEDAPAGVAAAHAAGIRVVGLTTSTPKAELERLPGVAIAVSDFSGVDFASLDALVRS
jgi:HAD superfamily hydrolase (TIGR01509 family)